MIALAFCGDLKYCPYIKRYIERLEAAHEEYKVYFWNRGAFQLDLPENYIYMDTFSELTKGKAAKAFDFLKFRSWLIQNLKRDKPDKVVALSTLTGVVLGDFLCRSSMSYVFDIRDYSYEHILPFYEIEKKVIKNSVFTAISSRGFESFLPPNEYVIAHNFNRKDVVEGKKYQKHEGKITFVWNGVVRFFDYQKRYLNALKNDERFEIVFHGDGPELGLFKDYCRNEGFENISFTGTYENAQKEHLLENAGILNNCYGYLQNAGNKLKYAVSNRFYDGIIYHIPQLVEPEGYKTNWVKEAKIGVSFDAEDGFTDKLYNYYINIDSAEFDKACEDTLYTVMQEDDEYIRQIDRFIGI